MLGDILYVTLAKIECSNPVFVQSGSHQFQMAIYIYT